MVFLNVSSLIVFASFKNCSPSIVGRLYASFGILCKSRFKLRNNSVKDFNCPGGKFSWFLSMNPGICLRVFLIILNAWAVLIIWPYLIAVVASCIRKEFLSSFSAAASCSLLSFKRERKDFCAAKNTLLCSCRDIKDNFIPFRTELLNFECRIGILITGGLQGDPSGRSAFFCTRTQLFGQIHFRLEDVQILRRCVQTHRFL